MEPTILAQNLSDFIKDLDSSLEWLKLLGIRHTRFYQYRQTLQIVHEYRVAEKLEKLSAIVPPEQYREAFIESTHLVAIKKGLQRFKGPKFKEKLRVGVGGPASPANEKSGGANARDFLFELSTAAFFRARKIPVLVWTDKDSLLRLGGCTLLVECKRPRSENKLYRSIKDATQQLIKQFGSYDREVMPRGLIALDISLITNPAGDVLTSDSIEAIRIELDAVLDRFVNKFGRELAYFRDKRILGILVFLKVLGFNSRDFRHLNCQKLGLYVHASDGSYEAILANELYRILLPCQ